MSTSKSIEKSIVEKSKFTGDTTSKSIEGRKYNHFPTILPPANFDITFEYAFFVKQFVVHLAVVQLYRIVLCKTNDVFTYISRPQDDVDRCMFDKLFDNLIREHQYSTQVWDEIFGESNIYIPLLYFTELYTNISNNPEKTYTQSYIKRKLRLYSVDVFASSPFKIQEKHANMEEAIRIHQDVEKRKFTRNCIIYEVIEIISKLRPWEMSDIDTRPYYVYVNHFKKHAHAIGMPITDISGKIEITETIIRQYADPSIQKQVEVYSIWLIDRWLQ